MFRRLTPYSLLLASACSTFVAAAIITPRAASAAAPLQSTAPQRAPVIARTSADTALAVHVLNRLAFGPRPDDVGRILDIGIPAWIEQQLLADSALDKSALSALKGCDVWTAPVRNAVALLSARETFAMRDTNGMMRPAGITFGGVEVVSRDSANRIMRSPQLGLYLANGQLHGCRLTRLESSEWQLLEVMTDFWENHFSIHGKSVPVRGAYLEYDRVTIRPNALGRFRKILGDVAHSPAMLHYLDNAVNSADSSRASLAPYQKPQLPNYNTINSSIRPVFQRPGLNENYARELLELHTMGVDGGYTQADVISVARALTGWSHPGVIPGGDELFQVLAISWRSLSSPSRPAPSPVLSFVFDSSRHDAEVKVVLGHTLPPNRGLEDGEDVLDIIARHPSTARFIARKLAVRFVSDTPPEGLVNSAAATFTRTNGDIREVLRTIFTSPEFLSPKVFGAKVKSPLEFVLSLRRALAAPVDTAAEMVDLLVNLHQPPAGRFSPDGWPETGSPWMTPGAMSTRIDIVTRIARDSLPSIPVSAWPEWTSLADEPFDVQMTGVLQTLLMGRTTPTTRAAIAALRPRASTATDAESRTQLLRDIIRFALSSPEFQRR